MFRQLLRPVSALVLVLAAGGPAATAATAIRAPRAVDPARVGLAQNHLASLQTQLGLSGAAGFQVRHAFTDAQGRTIVHFQQTHQGVPVWHGAAIVHVGPDGQVARVINALATGIQLTGAPALSAAQATARALRDLAPKGPMPLAPQVTEVVFPSGRTGGFATKVDPATGKVTLDKEYSVWAKASSAPYVWAYEVRTSLMNEQDGLKQVAYIIDGTTGAVLRKWNDLRADSVAQGTGNSLYNGTVVLTTTQSGADGTFSLQDPTRGTSSNNLTYTTGLGTFYDYYLNQGGGYFAEQPAGYTENPVDTWGDGTVYADGTTASDANGDFWWTGAETTQGQTNAVDAQYGMAMAWDLFQNAFGYTGMDNQGTSLSAIVHYFAPVTGYTFVPTPYTGHNFFSYYDDLILGDGDGKTRGPQTELDIVGHEMAHAFCMAVPNFSYAGESAALEEATSDILGKMSQAYAQAGTGGTIPDFPATDAAGLQKLWSFGYNADMGSPERYFYQPSLDGLSPDGWYDGMDVLMPWYANGPINKMFFHLVNGTSATATDPTYSSFLPVATTGLGNDLAARIWFRAVSAYMTADTDFVGALAAADQAVMDLGYPQGSPQETQVLNAFAAANIGDAPNQPKRVKVTFPVINAASSLIGQGGTVWYPAGASSQYQFFPPHTAVNVQIDVANATNPAVTWAMGPATTGGLTGGTLNADGTWTTPFSENPQPTEPYYLMATSVEAPNQFAVGAMMIVNIDADTDGTMDALDLGQIAACWGLNLQQDPFPATSLWDGNGTGDWDIALFNQVLDNAWPVH